MEIDLKFRPAGYFWPLSLATHLLSRVKGAERQRQIRQLIAQGKLNEVDAWLAAESLSDASRVQLGRCHPSLMGGEYLPDLRLNEVEIARISLLSVTGDVISVRATQGKRRIYYRIVDEYEGDSVPEHSRRTSIKPLTLSQLERFIERASAGMDIIYFNWSHGEEIDSLPAFLTATSPFYPELEALYQLRITTWIASEKQFYDDEFEHACA